MFPSIVSVGTATSAICGGVLINEKHVVTAARCVFGKVVADLQVVLAVDEATDRQALAVAQAVHHPGFNLLTHANDIAVITLAVPAVFSERAQPVRLAAENHVPTGEIAVAGWGNAHPAGSTPAVIPDMLRWLRTDVVEPAACQAAYAGLATITEGMFCAARGATGPCTGDEGGPVYDVAGQLIGVISWGMLPCAQSRYPSVFTRVGHYRAWLDSATAGAGR